MSSVYEDLCAKATVVDTAEGEIRILMDRPDFTWWVRFDKPSDLFVAGVDGTQANGAVIRGAGEATDRADAAARAFDDYLDNLLALRIVNQMEPLLAN